MSTLDSSPEVGCLFTENVQVYLARLPDSAGPDHHGAAKRRRAVVEVPGGVKVACFEALVLPLRVHHVEEQYLVSKLGEGSGVAEGDNIR